MRADAVAAPGRPVSGVTVAVPEGWHLLPARAVSSDAADDAEQEWVPYLRPLLDHLAAEAAGAGVLVCAFGTLRDGELGAACVLAVHKELAAGEMSSLAERLAGDDPGSDPREELCWLELAGPSGRLSWAPRASSDGRRAACVQYFVPFPGDDSRVAVLVCSAVGAEPSGAVFDELDRLAATVCFSTGPGRTAAEASL